MPLPIQDTIWDTMREFCGRRRGGEKKGEPGLKKILRAREEGQTKYPIRRLLRQAEYTMDEFSYSPIHREVLP